MDKWETPTGVATTVPPGRRIATVLLRLKTSIPIVFMFIKMSLFGGDCNWSVPVLLIAHSIYCGVTQTHPECGLTCIKRTLRMKILLADYFTGAKSKEKSAIPIAFIILTA